MTAELRSFFSRRRWKLPLFVVAMATTLIYVILHERVLNSQAIGTTLQVMSPLTTIQRPMEIMSISRPMEIKSRLMAVPQPMEIKFPLMTVPRPVEIKPSLISMETAGRGSNLMIISYMRSGSTLNGRIFGENPENFYVFEPLIRLAPSCYLTENSLCEMHTLKCRADRTDNKTEQMKSSSEPVRDGMNTSHNMTDTVKLLQEKTIKAFKDIFNCNLTNLNDKILRSIMFEHWVGESKSGESWNNFTTCYVKLAEPGVTNMSWYLEKARTEEFGKHQHIIRLLEHPSHKADMFRRCLNELESHCRKTELRLTKVLRVSLRFLPSIMREIPDLKVLLLIRDPRGIMNSRIQTRWFPITEDEPNLVRDNIESLCFKMQEDIKMIDSLKAEFPGRFLELSFESIAEEPLESFRTIFKFCGLKLTEVYSAKIKKV